MTRLPRAGFTKTRLIPAMGAEGAAEFHDRLARHTIGRASAYCLETGSHLTVRIEGGTPIEAKQWLGDDSLDCREQSIGDLGQRLVIAVDEAFAEGAKRVIVVGSDCPSIDRHIYHQANEFLENREVVLGPALDGGYYLIGMKHLAKTVFEDIPWGTEKVMAATLEAARKASLPVGICAALPDVDVEDDLENAEAVLRNGASISVIIPTLNEASRIGDLIQELLKSSPHEVIVSDGGSDDFTAEIAAKMGAKVISSPRGRGVQMNQGAALATGEYLLFLHADTVPPKGFPNLISNILNRPGTSAGAFRFKLSGNFGAAPLIEALVNLRCRFLQTPYGDQGLFMRRSCFEYIAAFPEYADAEDLLLVRKLKKHGKIRVTAETASTSPRRWEQKGLIRTFIRHQLIILASRFHARY